MGEMPPACVKRSSQLRMVMTPPDRATPSSFSMTSSSSPSYGRAPGSWRSAARLERQPVHCSNVVSPSSASSWVCASPSVRAPTWPVCPPKSMLSRSRSGRTRATRSTLSTRRPHGTGSTLRSATARRTSCCDRPVISPSGARSTPSPSTTTRLRRDPGGLRRHRRKPPRRVAAFSTRSGPRRCCGDRSDRPV